MKLKEEIKRVQAEPGGYITVDKAAYLQMLKELKVLRFKISSKLYWRTEGEQDKAERQNDSNHLRRASV